MDDCHLCSAFYFFGAKFRQNVKYNNLKNQQSVTIFAFFLKKITNFFLKQLKFSPHLDFDFSLAAFF
jgi:hypothetical protein